MDIKRIATVLFILVASGVTLVLTACTESGGVPPALPPSAIAVSSPAALPTATSVAGSSPAPKATAASPATPATPQATSTAVPTATWTPTLEPTPTPGITEFANPNEVVVIRSGCGEVFDRLSEVAPGSNVELLGVGIHNDLHCYQVRLTISGQSVVGWIPVDEVSAINVAGSDLMIVTLPALAVADTVSINEGDSYNIPVFLNDWGPLERSTFELIRRPQGGVGVDRANGIFTYSPPDEEYNGVDTLRYRVAGANGEVLEAEVMITVNAVNDPPVITNNGQAFVIAENSTTLSEEVRVVATDIDGPGLSYSITDGNINEAFTIDGSTGQISINNPRVLNYENPDTRSFNLSINVSDGTAVTQGGISITLNNVAETARVTIHFRAAILDRVGLHAGGTEARFNYVADLDGRLNEGLHGYPSIHCTEEDTLFWPDTIHRFFDCAPPEYNSFTFLLNEDQKFFVNVYGNTYTQRDGFLFIGAHERWYSVSELATGKTEYQVKVPCEGQSYCEDRYIDFYIIFYEITVER